MELSEINEIESKILAGAPQDPAEIKKWIQARGWIGPDARPLLILRLRDIATTSNDPELQVQIKKVLARLGS